MWRILFIGLAILASCLNPESAYEAQQNNQNDTQNRLVIRVLDVGQGAATLVIGPNGQAGLIDAGPPLAGLGQVLPALRALGIDALSWVIISHYDADHLGGLVEILKGEDQVWDNEDDIRIVGSIWDRGGEKFKATPWFDDYRSEIDQRNIITPGQSFELGQGAVMTAVLVAGHYQDGFVQHLNSDEENEASIALLIEYGDFRYLTAGDLTGGGFSGERESKDLESYLASLVGSVDIVHLNHHGSRTSTNETYIDTLKPAAAIISAGSDNSFGHPHAEVMERLEAHQITIYQTMNGTLVVTADGDGFSVE